MGLLRPVDKEDVGQVQELSLFWVQPYQKQKKKKKVTCRLHLLLLKRFKAKKMFTEKHKEIFVEVIKRAPAGHFIKGVLEYLVTSPDQGRAS